MNIKQIQTIASPLDFEITPPGSKSITNRAFVIAGLAKGESVLTGVLDSDDTRYMRGALQQLGVTAEQNLSDNSARIIGCSGLFPASQAELFLGNSGTSIRFLAAAVIHSHGIFTLDGIERMRQRPIGDLVNALRQWGVEIKYLQNDGFPPLQIHANANGGQTCVAGNISSQFLSGLLIAAVGLKNDTTITVTGELVSRPYIDMTIAVMRAFGATVTEPQPQQFFIPGNQQYCGINYAIEPDASAASYFFAAAAIVSGTVKVNGLTHSALQGDIRFVDCLKQMGCDVYEEGNATVVHRTNVLHGIDVDMHHISDTAQTLGVTALFADSPTTIRNVANMRVKETDRISALCTELRKFGARVDEFDDGLKIWPLPVEQYKPARIATYNDHRMAMSFAVAGLKIPSVEIENPECTSKTFPNFFEMLPQNRD